MPRPENGPAYGVMADMLDVCNNYLADTKSEMPVGDQMLYVVDYINDALGSNPSSDGIPIRLPQEAKAELDAAGSAMRSIKQPTPVIAIEGRIRNNESDRDSSYNNDSDGFDDPLLRQAVMLAPHVPPNMNMLIRVESASAPEGTSMHINTYGRISLSPDPDANYLTRLCGVRIPVTLDAEGEVHKTNGMGQTHSPLVAALAASQSGYSQEQSDHAKKAYELEHGPFGYVRPDNWGFFSEVRLAKGYEEIYEVIASLQDPMRAAYYTARTALNCSFSEHGREPAEIAPAATADTARLMIATSLENGRFTQTSENAGAAPRLTIKTDHGVLHAPEGSISNLFFNGERLPALAS